MRFNKAKINITRKLAIIKPVPPKTKMKITVRLLRDCAFTELLSSTDSLVSISDIFNC